MYIKITKVRFSPKPYLVEAFFADENHSPDYIGHYVRFWDALRAAHRPVRVMEQWVFPDKFVLKLH